MDQDEKVKLSIDIFGTNYKLVGSFSEKYVKKLSQYVNEHMNTIAKGNPRLDTQKVAVLSLVQMADDYFQLRGQWDAIEEDRAQAKERMEELRKAFELSEEKERLKSGEVVQLQERIAALEAEREESRRETELAGLAWAEQVEEWRLKYEEAQASAVALKETETNVRLLTEERESLRAELERSRQEAASAGEAAAPARTGSHPGTDIPSASATASSAAQPNEEETLQEKYRKLQEEYVKLQNEFDEWIQLTQSETQ